LPHFAPFFKEFPLYFFTYLHRRCPSVNSPASAGWGVVATPAVFRTGPWLGQKVLFLSRTFPFRNCSSRGGGPIEPPPGIAMKRFLRRGRNDMQGGPSLRGFGAPHFFPFFFPRVYLFISFFSLCPLVFLEAPVQTALFRKLSLCSALVRGRGAHFCFCAPSTFAALQSLAAGASSLARPSPPDCGQGPTVCSAKKASPNPGSRHSSDGAGARADRKFRWCRIFCLINAPGG